MNQKPISLLSSKKRYLQIALNSTLEEARLIITKLPQSDRILIEAGTSLIKRYGEQGISNIQHWTAKRMTGISSTASPVAPTIPYVVADLKTMDRGETEVELAAKAGANAATVLGNAPIETINAFIEKCEKNRMDAMVDMMNVPYPLAVLSSLKTQPRVVVLHLGVDEEAYNKQKKVPLHEIRRIKGRYSLMIAIAGGDTLREVQSAIFNDADIVVIWKSVFQSTNETINIIEGFLKQIK